MKKEIWKDIAGYEGLYKVSNYGRVKSLARLVRRGFCEIWVEEKMMTIHNCKSKGNGYFSQVTLFKEGRQKSYRIHRLVALAFLNREKGCNQVDHINGDKLDNRAENLRWVNQNENINNPVTKSMSKRLVPVSCYTIDGKFVKTFPSITSASKYLNIPLSSISCILNGTSGMSGRNIGYVFSRCDIRRKNL